MANDVTFIFEQGIKLKAGLKKRLLSDYRSGILQLPLDLYVKSIQSIPDGYEVDGRTKNQTIIIVGVL